jgi:putative tryptophan/tyrosine transport system substrate-binding protein
VATAWPIAAEAQQQAVRVIGFLHMESFDLFADRPRAFRQGLSQTGHVESRSRVKLA